jgi:hypothetical protein
MDLDLVGAIVASKEWVMSGLEGGGEERGGAQDVGLIVFEARPRGGLGSIHFG